MNATDSIQQLYTFERTSMLGNKPTPTTHKTEGQRDQQTTGSYKSIDEIEKTAAKQDRSMEKFSLVKEKELTLKEKLDIQRLEQMERSIREHERSHMVAARDLAISSPNFRLEHGPDGQEYAVGGEVNISASTVDGDAQGTIDKALKIERAALAPSDPSAQDMQVAAQARSIASKAYRKLAREQIMDVIYKPTQEEQEAQKMPDAINPYLKHRDFQKNLSTMLDLFT